MQIISLFLKRFFLLNVIKKVAQTITYGLRDAPGSFARSLLMFLSKYALLQPTNDDYEGNYRVKNKEKEPLIGESTDNGTKPKPSQFSLSLREVANEVLTKVLPIPHYLKAKTSSFQRYFRCPSPPVDFALAFHVQLTWSGLTPGTLPQITRYVKNS